MVQAIGRPSPLVVVAGFFFSRDDTHSVCGVAFRSDGTVSPWAGSKARRGLLLGLGAVITTMADGDNHHLVP